MYTLIFWTFVNIKDSKKNTCSCVTIAEYSTPLAKGRLNVTIEYLSESSGTYLSNKIYTFILNA